jgi:plastocyanin
MKTKIIVLLLIFGVVLLSGCAGDEQPSPDENATPEETETPEENVTAVETETPEENVTEETGGVITPATKPTTYTIRLDNNRASRSDLEIKQGDTVAWLNWEDSPRRTFTLVSEENLFDNTNLAYKRPFVYTFNETGEYHFSVVGQPRMNVTVSVVEP